MTIGANALAIISPLLLLLFGLGFTVLIDPYIQKKAKADYADYRGTVPDSCGTKLLGHSLDR